MTSAPNFSSALPLLADDAEGQLLIAMKLFELGRATLGQAANMAGYSQAGFIDVLGHHRIPVVNYPVSELSGELAW